MIVFRGRRGGSVVPTMSGHRQAAVTPSGGREKRPFGRPCRPLRSRRAALVMRPHHGGPRSGPESLQGRQMCHPPMKVSTKGNKRRVQ